MSIYFENLLTVMKQNFSFTLSSIFVLLFFLCNSPLIAQENLHSHNGKRIKINSPNLGQLQTLTQIGVDLKCGAEITENAVYLELGEDQIYSLEEAGIPFTIIIDDLIAFHQERNETALPFAIHQLELEKQQTVLSSENGQSRSLSTASTTLSNVIQHEGEVKNNWQTPQNFTLGSMGGCLTYEEMKSQLDLMKSLYPNLISVKKDASLQEDGSGTPLVTHGNSFTNGGQYDTWPGQTIYYVRISDNPETDESNEPESFYSGMTHSREVSSMMNLMYYMWYLLENYDTDPDVKNLVDHNEMYFVPVANPDGLLWNEQIAPSGGGLQRKNLNPTANPGNNNLRGVDLNRNYSYLWGTAFGGSSGTPSSNVYRGTAPFSEPETRIVEEFVANHDVKTALNHHATSNLLPHAYNGEVGAPSSGREDDYAQFCQDLTKFNRYIYGEAPNILTVANGDMSDWMLGGPIRTNSDGSTSIGSGKEILALAPENGDPSGLEANPDFGSGFWPSPDQIVYIAKRAMRMNFVNALYAGKTAQFHDKTPSNITTTSGTLDFDIEYLGMTDSDLTLTVTPVSGFSSISALPLQSSWVKQEQRSLSVNYTLGAVVPNDPLEYEVTLSNDNNIIYQANIIKYYSPTELFVDDPDTDGISNWTASSNWSITTDGYNGSDGITNDATPPYGNSINATLTLNNALDLSSVNTAIIQFYAKWDIERNFDYAQLQASPDNGVTWFPLSGKYTKPGSTLSSTRYSPVTGSGSATKTAGDRDNQPDGKPVYEGFNDGKWVLEEIEISAAANTFVAGSPNLQLRFLFDSDSNNNTDGYTTTFDGFTFDDFKVLSYDIDRSCLAGTLNSFPYAESFEGGLGDWTQNIEDDGDLTLGSGETPSAGTGPSLASDGTYYYFAEASTSNIGLGSNAQVIVTSPCIDLNGGVLADFVFDYHMLGTNTGSLELEVSESTSNTWTNLFTITGAQSANGTDWLTQNVNLNSYTDTTIQLRFVITTGGGAASDIAIDNLRINPADTTNPDAICQNISVSLGADGTVTILPEDINNGSTDNVAIDTLTIDVDTFNCTQVGTNNVILTVTDLAGNSDTCTAIVTVDPYITPPTGLSASSITINSATLDWDAAASGDYEIRFRESGTTTWTTVNVTTNTYLVSSLDSETTYEAQVRSNCVTGNTPYSASITFTTASLCPGVTISTFPYNEGFNVDIGNWTQNTDDDNTATDNPTDTSSNWTVDGNGTGTNNTGPSSPAEGSDYIYLESSNPNNVNDPNAIGFNATAIITSPCIDLTGFTQATYSFQYHMYGSNMGTLDTQISTDYGMSWASLLPAIYSGNLGDQWNAESINLDAFTGQVIQLRFVGVTGGGQRSDMAVDDVEVTALNTGYVYDGSSWSPTDPSGVSTLADNISVLSGSINLTADTDCQNLVIAPGASLDLGTTSFTIEGNLTNSGTLLASDATLIMTGNTAQAIDGSFEVSTLTTNNTTTVTLNSPIAINTLLNLNSGTIDSGGNLTFLSSATETAMINQVTTGSILGDVIVERFIPARRAFRFMSSAVTSTTTINDNWQEGVNNTGTNFPVDNLNPNPGYGTHITGSTSGANGFDATGSGNPSLFTLNNTSQAFEVVTDTDTNTLVAGNPYLLMVRGSRDVNLTTNSATPSDTRLRTLGTLVIGNNTTTGGDLNHTTGSFNLFGNPYQSSVDMNTVVAGSTNINTNQYYVWDPTLGVRGAYVTVLLTGTGSSNGAGSAANHYLQPGQGAFVTTATTVGDNSTSILFTESDKVVGQNTSVFFDGQSSDQNDPILNNAHIIGQLFHTDSYNSGGKLQDNFVIIFSPDDSNSINLKDAPKWYNLDENMAIQNGDATLSVERRFLPTQEDEIPLFNNSYKVSDYTLVINQQGLNDVGAYLNDAFTGNEIPLTSGENVIPFSVDDTNDASIASDRFKITFRENQLSTENVNAFDFSMYPNPLSSNELHITSDDLAGSDVIINVTNILGQSVIKEVQQFNQDTILSGFDILRNGIYFIKLTSDQGSVTRRLIKQ